MGGEWDDAGRSIRRMKQVLGAMPQSLYRNSSNAALAAAEDRLCRMEPRRLAIERFRIIRRAADLLRERAEGLVARIVTREMGKPHAQALGETVGAADLIDFLGEEAKRQGGRLVPVRGPQSA